MKGGNVKHRIRLACASAVVTLAGAGAGGADPAAAGPSRAGVLVGRLGEPSYTAREEAGRLLAELGRAAGPAVGHGVRDEDAEVRRRCAELLRRLGLGREDARGGEFAANGDAGAGLPGWAVFKGLAGDDLAARLLYLQLLRADRPLLEALRRDPRAAGAQAGPRRQRLARRIFYEWEAGGGEALAGEVGALLLAAAVAGREGRPDRAEWGRLQEVLASKAVREVLAGRPWLGRLFGPAVGAHLDDPRGFEEAAELAKELEVEEAAREVLVPAVLRHLGRAPPRDLRGLVGLGRWAARWGAEAEAAARVGPVVRRLAEEAARDRGDLDRLDRAATLAEALGLNDLLEGFIKPAVLRRTGEAAAAGDAALLAAAANLGRDLEMDEEVRAVAEPAARRVVLAAARRPVEERQLAALTAVADLAPAKEQEDLKRAVLPDLAGRCALALLEQGDDPATLKKAWEAAQRGGRADLVEGTVAPLARAAVARAAAAADLGALAAIDFHVGVLLQKSGEFKDVVRPVLPRAYTRAAAARALPADELLLALTLNWARWLDIREALPYTLLVAGNGSVSAFRRAEAVVLAGKLGGREVVPALERLLDDRGVIWPCRAHALPLRAEVRDVALAVLVRVTGQSLKEYGFPHFRVDPQAGEEVDFHGPQEAGFLDEEERAGALAKWRAWRAGAGKK